MTLYKYRAYNQQGRTILGTAEAADENAVISLLKDKGLVVVGMTKKSELNFGNLPFISAIKAKDVVVFSRQFSVLVSANVALVHSLKLLVAQLRNQRLKKIIADVASDVDGGSRLSDALRKYPNVFTSFYVSVVKAGETSGKLDEVLNYLADELEKDYDMNSKIKGALIYPAVIMTGLLVVGVIMMVVVVPKLTEIISSSGGELPLPTKILIAVSKFLEVYWWFLLALALTTYFSLRAFAHTPAGKFFFDKLLLRLPIFGHLYNLIYIVRFSRSMNTLIAGGVGLSSALGITADVVSNDVYKKLIFQTRKEVEDGNSISSAFMDSEQIPVMVSQMMSIGEKTGKLDMILTKITDFYTREINNIIANLMTLMEPLVIIIIGIGVGTMVAAIILPMYRMADSF